MKNFKELRDLLNYLLNNLLIITIILALILLPVTYGLTKIPNQDSPYIKTIITIINSAIISLSIAVLINQKIEATRKKDLASGILSYAFGVVLPKELSEELGKSIEQSRIIRKNVRIYIDINLSSNNTKKIIVSIVFNAELYNITSSPQEYTDKAFLEPTDNSMRMNHEPIIVFTNNKGDEIKSEYKYENQDEKQIEKTSIQEWSLQFNSVSIKFWTLLDVRLIASILFVHKHQTEYRPVKITKTITIEPSQYINHYKKITLESERIEYFSDNYVLPYPMIGIDLYISYPQDYQVILWQAMSSQMKDLSKLQFNNNENNQKNHQVYSTQKAVLANNGFTIEVFKKQ